MRHLGFWQIIWKRRKLVILLMAAVVSMTIVVSLIMPDIYQAKAVIIPVVGKESGSGNASLAALALQMGGLPGVPLSASATASEIVSLLQSNILRQKIIEQYRLMPILFPGKWDQNRQVWKQGYGIGEIRILNSVPGTWDGIRMLEECVNIHRNNKDNTITISVDFRDPKYAAQIADHYLISLTNYMSSEAKRVAETNRKYLEEQLGSTNDPFIKQKTYNLIAQQIENGMMAEVKENFAFKIIDPPMPPDKKIKPQRGMMALLSLVVALLIGITIAQFIEYYENIKKHKGEVRK